jgi:HlyD family secretion protein
VEIDLAQAPLKSLTYFTVRDGKRIDPAHTRTIRVTPDTVERARFGGIEGEIESVSAFPVGLEHVERVIGNREVARGLVDAGFRIEVMASLEGADTPSGLAWSSSRGPELEITAGTTTSARVAVERRRPITFVLPYLRTLFGVD